MSRIVKVEVANVLPNPWRDGKGEATWRNLSTTYPVIEEKLERLKESFLTTEVWEGVIAREVDWDAERGAKSYQLAFGHHRFLAYKALVREGKMEDGLFPLIVRDLGDDDMILFMSNENDEEWKHKFLLATMNPVSAVVAAYGNGTIQLEEPGKEGGGARDRRSAPSFAVVGNDPCAYPYNASTVARYLGWQTAEGKASARTLTAIAALELIEKGILSKEQFLQLSHQQSQMLVRVTKDELKRQEQEIEVEKKILLDAQKKAFKERDTNKVEALETKLQGVQKRLEKAPAFKAKSIATRVVSELKSGASTREALVKVGREEATPAPKKESPEPPTITLVRSKYLAMTQRAFREDMGDWEFLLAKAKPGKPTEELITELKNAATRARNRAKELEDKIND